MRNPRMICKTIIHSVLVLFLSCVVAQADELEDAGRAFLRGDYGVAVQLIRPLAEVGNATAQVGLGGAYAGGLGVPQDHKEAVKWFRLAAAQGDALAQNFLGNACIGGLSVPKDLGEARKWYQLSAEQGHSQAQYNLGVAYYEGLGVPQDFDEGIKWFHLAASQGNSNAQYNLGVVYEKGLGVSQNYKESAGWYRLAAMQGHAGAQVNLGVLYVNGLGVLQNYIDAHVWWNLAAAQGNENGLRNRELIKESMTTSQLAEAQKRANEFRPISEEASAGYAQRTSKEAPNDFLDEVDASFASGATAMPAGRQDEESSFEKVDTHWLDIRALKFHRRLIPQRRV